MGGRFEHTIRVRYAECDPQGVVFNANYLSYFDISITELWRAAYGSYGVMIDRGIDLVVVETTVRFRAPARFDDELTLGVELTRIGHRSVSTHHTVRRGTDELTDGEMTHVFVQRTTLAATPIPDWARDGLAPWDAR
ncbi:MAG: acyl-CoA thioesterase [Solirubrobacteraceae bacterium]